MVLVDCATYVVGKDLNFSGMVWNNVLTLFAQDVVRKNAIGIYMNI
jgi:hypothetical protein